MGCTKQEKAGTVATARVSGLLWMPLDGYLVSSGYRTIAHRPCPVMISRRPPGVRLDRLPLSKATHSVAYRGKKRTPFPGQVEIDPTPIDSGRGKRARGLFVLHRAQESAHHEAPSDIKGDRFMAPMLDLEQQVDIVLSQRSGDFHA